MPDRTPDVPPTPNRELLQYGGQAVIEGVMMRSPHYFAVACRKPNGEIVVQREDVDRSILGRLKWMNRPVLRGTLALIDAMALGTRALTFASNVQLRAERESQSGPLVTSDQESARAKHNGNGSKIHAVEEEVEAGLAAGVNGLPLAPAVPARSGKINDIAIGGAFVFTALAVVAFRAFPTLLTEFLSKHVFAAHHAANITLNAFDGLIRIGLFFAYIIGISFMPQIREVFKYHGAEHKAINTLEAGLPLTVENALQASRIHPRCGTSFIFVVFFVDLIVCLFLPRPVWYLRVLLHLAILPPVAGLAYEIIKLAGSYRRNPLVMAAFAPGMSTQYLTTREPDAPQVEIALAALYSVLVAEGHSALVPANDPPHVPDPDEPAMATA